MAERPSMELYELVDLIHAVARRLPAPADLESGWSVTRSQRRRRHRAASKRTSQPSRRRAAAKACMADSEGNPPMTDELTFDDTSNGL